MTTDPPAPLGAARPRPSWLISPAADLLWLHGSVALSYAFFFAWRGGLITGQQLLILWIFGFHGPHFWGTISRTWIDPSERAQRGRFLVRTLWWFAVGPTLVVAAALTGWKDLERAFFFFAAVWAYHHVVKQHFGFVALYRAKAREFDKRGFERVRWYLILSLWLPVGVTLLQSPHWLPQIPLVGVVQQRFDPSALLAIVTRLGTAAWALFWVLQVLYLGSLALAAARGRGPNLLSLSVVLASVPLHALAARAALEVSLQPGADPFDAYAFVPLTTIFHNVQYHALIWHYNRAKYRGEGARERYGLAAVLNRNLPVYFACGLAYTLATIGLEYYGLGWFERSTIAGSVASAFLWGVSFAHYYTDGAIWHVRSDPNLRRVLGFPEPPAPAVAGATASAAD